MRFLQNLLAGLATSVAAFADQPQAKPRPEGFGSATPAPSSLVLVLAGLAGLLAWNWWRSRARGERVSND